MVGEFGVLERKPGEKEQWFRQAHDWIAAHPAIAAVVYFNADSTTQGIYYDWRVDTSPSSFEGFRYLFTGTAPVRPRACRTDRPRRPPPSRRRRPVAHAHADHGAEAVEGHGPARRRRPPTRRPST